MYCRQCFYSNAKEIGFVKRHNNLPNVLCDVAVISTLPLFCCFKQQIKMFSGPVTFVSIPLRFTPATSDFPSMLMKPQHSFTRISCSRKSSPQQQQQLNLSVLRFTFGIPGLDESYLPRYIGYAFGALMLLNHFVTSDTAITQAQLTTEAIGISLAAFSIVVPYIGKFLKEATPADPKNIQEGVDQIFVMSKNIADNVKEDLAWGTYTLLRNTNSISVLISVGDAICARGYWNVPKNVLKECVPDWFRERIDKIGFSELVGTIYFQQADSDSELMGMMPGGVRSLLVQPIVQGLNLNSDRSMTSVGLVIVASSIDYAYSDKDKAWITAVANKFKFF